MKRLVCILVPLLFAAVLARQDNATPSGNTNKYVLEDSCLGGLRAQLNLEMHASLLYQQMAAHFDSNQVAHKGFAKFFEKSSDEEREHAKKITNYINARGGTIGHLNVRMPSSNSWDTAKEALQAALVLEHHVNNELHLLHRTADEDCRDPQLQDFLESNFLSEQVESIAQIERLITNLNKFGDVHLGEYFVNKDLL
uniref:Ferritin n=1 Tax=Dermanyssus gallinae TaxID=34641 RepID=A0A8E5KGP6_9ACAR|nr:ferritin 1 [Dermanyssus gallinae]BDW80174.1 ferritin 2 [Dermanyssus gallinae]